MSPCRSILSLLLLFVVGCSAVEYHSKVVDTDPEEWTFPANLSLAVSDTVQQHDLQLIMRYSNLLKVDSVELLVTTTAPDGVYWSDRLTLYPRRNGRSFNTLQSTYRRNVRWSQIGEYNIVFQPQRTYRGVTAIGLDIIPLD